MGSILIKDTTREQRMKIVQDSLDDLWDVGCGGEGFGIDYDLYIDGKVELKDLNAQANCGFVVAYPDESEKSSCVQGL